VKKYLAIALLLMLTSCMMAACSRETPAYTPSMPAELGKSCQEIIEYLYANVEQTQYIKDKKTYSMFYRADDVRNRCAWFLGKEGIPFSDASASESMISPSDYSLVVVKISEGENYEQWKTAINDNIKADKWICMGAETKRVEKIGNVVLIVLADKANADNIAKAFLDLK